METRISSIESKVEQILLDILEIKKNKKERKENKPRVRSATQKIPKDVDSNIYEVLLELRRKIYETNIRLISHMGMMFYSILFEIKSRMLKILIKKRK